MKTLHRLFRQPIFRKLLSANLKPSDYDWLSNEHGISPEAAKAIVCYGEPESEAHTWVIERAASKAWRENDGYGFKLAVAGFILALILCTWALAWTGLRIWIHYKWDL